MDRESAYGAGGPIKPVRRRASLRISERSWIIPENETCDLSPLLQILGDFDGQARVGRAIQINCELAIIQPSS